MNIYVAKNEQKHGPFSPEEVRARVAAGEFGWSDLGWHEGAADWRPLSQLLPATPPPASGALPPPEKRRSRLAKASFVIAMIAIGGWILLCAISIASAAFRSSGALAVAIGLCTFAVLGLNLVGAIFGLLRIGKRISNKWMAVTGTIVNGLALVGVLLLFVVAMTVARSSNDLAKKVKVQADIRAIRTQLLLYESMNGFLPTTEQGLDALVTRPTTEPMPERWSQLLEETPKDPWSHAYVYRQPGTRHTDSFDLFSAGPDRVPDTADDEWTED